MRIGVLLLLMGSLLALQPLFCDEDTPLPGAAQIAVTALEHDLAKLVAKSTADLQKIEEQEARAGHLEKAVAVKRLIDRLKSRLNESCLRPRAPQVPGIYDIVANGWNHITTMAFDEQHVVTASDGEVGRWEIHPDGVLLIVWPNGNTNRGVLTAGVSVLAGDKGDPFSMALKAETQATAR